MTTEALLEKLYAQLTMAQEPGTAVELDVEAVRQVVRLAKEHLEGQPAIQALAGNIYVVGDTHGQLHDVLNYFDILGSPLTHNYLFLGDVIDRGRQSIECLVLMLVCKLRRPANFFLIRGNHETEDLATSQRGQTLRQECRDRYPCKGDELFQSLVSVFPYLPIAAIIGRRILCLHGCIASTTNLRFLSSLTLPISVEAAPPHLKIMLADLLWSDPLGPGVGSGIEPGQQDTVVTFNNNDTQTQFPVYYNRRRNSGELVSDELACHLLDEYGFDLLVRGHECYADGLSTTPSGRIFTVFGATHYYQSNEDVTAATVMVVSEDLTVRFVQFYAEADGTVTIAPEAFTRPLGGPGVRAR